MFSKCPFLCLEIDRLEVRLGIRKRFQRWKQEPDTIPFKHLLVCIENQFSAVVGTETRKAEKVRDIWS